MNKTLDKLLHKLNLMKKELSETPIGDQLAKEMKIKLDLKTEPKTLAHQMTYEREFGIHNLTCSCGSRWLDLWDDQEVYEITLRHSGEVLNAYS